jgi:ubiquinol-cytochrome c reductase cytochrome c subunit
VAGVAIGLGLVLSRPASSAPSTARQASEVDAKEVYLADCAVCHGQDGRGIANLGISLFGQGRAAVDYSLSTGRMPLAAVGRAEVAGRPVSPLPAVGLGDPGQVPTRHDPAYPPEVIKALVDYVAELTDETGPEIPRLEKGDVAEGGVQFRLQCAACHSWSGQGGALVERPVPALGASTPLQVAEAVRAGPGQMPAFGQAALDDHQLSSVVAYVEELKEPSNPGGQPLGRLGPFTEGAVALVGLVALLALCRWIGEREPKADHEPGGTAESKPDVAPAGSGGTDEPAGSAGEAQPANSGGTTA